MAFRDRSRKDRAGQRSRWQALSDIDDSIDDLAESLCEAIQNCHIEQVQYLLLKRIPREVITTEVSGLYSERHLTALHYAVEQCSPDGVNILKLLLQESLDKEALEIVAHGQIRRERQNKRGRSRPILEFEGYTPLCWACLSGNFNAVKALLLVGADPNSQNSFDKTTPLIAVSSRTMEGRSRQDLTNESRIVTALMNAGADVTLQDSNGSTALHYLLAQEHQLANARLILAKATKPIKTSNKNGWTLLHCCVSYIWSEEVESCIRSVVKNQSNAMEDKNKYNQTPLELAMSIGNKEAVAVLQELPQTAISSDRAEQVRSRFDRLTLNADPVDTRPKSAAPDSSGKETTVNSRDRESRNRRDYVEISGRQKPPYDRDVSLPTYLDASERNQHPSLSRGEDPPRTSQSSTQNDKPYYNTFSESKFGQRNPAESPPIQSNIFMQYVDQGSTGRLGGGSTGMFGGVNTGAFGGGSTVISPLSADSFSNRISNGAPPVSQPAQSSAFRAFGGDKPAETPPAQSSLFAAALKQNSGSSQQAQRSSFGAFGGDRPPQSPPAQSNLFAEAFKKNSETYQPAQSNLFAEAFKKSSETYQPAQSNLFGAPRKENSNASPPAQSNAFAEALKRSSKTYEPAQSNLFGAPRKENPKVSPSAQSNAFAEALKKSSETYQPAQSSFFGGSLRKSSETSQPAQSNLFGAFGGERSAEPPPAQNRVFGALQKESSRASQPAQRNAMSHSFGNISNEFHESGEDEKVRLPIIRRRRGPSPSSNDDNEKSRHKSITSFRDDVIQAKSSDRDLASVLLLKDESARLFQEYETIYGSTFANPEQRRVSTINILEKSKTDIYTAVLIQHAKAQLRIASAEYQAAYNIQEQVLDFCITSQRPINDKVLEAAILLTITYLHILGDHKQAGLVKSVLYASEGTVLGGNPWIALHALQQLIHRECISRNGVIVNYPQFRRWRTALIYGCTFHSITRTASRKLNQFTISTFEDCDTIFNLLIKKLIMQDSDYGNLTVFNVPVYVGEIVAKFRAGQEVLLMPPDTVCGFLDLLLRIGFSKEADEILDAIPVKERPSVFPNKGKNTSSLLLLHLEQKRWIRIKWIGPWKHNSEFTWI